MNINVFRFSFLVCATFLVLVFMALRKGVISERYGLFWLLFASVMLVSSSSPKVLTTLSHLLQIAYAPSVLLLLGFLFLVAYSFHLTVVLFQQSEKVLRLTQQLALLQNKVDALGAAGNRSREVDKP